MPFIPLQTDQAAKRDTPPQGFTLLASDTPRRGFTPLQQDDASRPSLARTIAQENPLTAMAEVAANLGTQMLALPVAGVAGLATEAGRAVGLTERSGADVVHQVETAMTYQPRGRMGQMGAELVAFPFEKLAELGQAAGEKTLDATGSPVVATAVDTAINALPMAVGPLKKTSALVRKRIAPRAAPDALLTESPTAQAEVPPRATETGPRAANAPAEPPVPGQQAPAAPGANFDAPASRGALPAEDAGHELQARTQRLGNDDPQMLGPEAQGLDVLRGPGNRSLPAMDDGLQPLAGVAERKPGLPAGQLPADNAGRAAAPEGVLPVGAPRWSADDRSRGGADAGAADAQHGTAAPGTRPVTERAGAEAVPPAEMADLRRQGPVPAGSPDPERMAPGTGLEPAGAPALDPNAGPLSRAAIRATVPAERPLGEAAQGGTSLDPQRGFMPLEDARAVPAASDAGSWTPFPQESGSLGIPRAQMPQIKAEHRGAFTQFAEARGVTHTTETVPAGSLRPTQAEYSPGKVAQALDFKGGNRSILVSSDGYVLDGHHQWLASLSKNEPVKVVRLNAPIRELVPMAREFPSSATEAGAPARRAQGFTPLRETASQAPVDVQRMAPGDAYTGFIDDARAPAGDATTVGRGKPLRREDVIVPFAKALGASIYTGRVRGKNVLGFFRRGNEEVRIKRHADLETTAHEMAHLLDSRVPEISHAWRANPALREQLRSVSYDQTKVSEGFAEAVRLWMTQPETLQQKAPLAHQWLTDFAARNERYGPAMQKAQEGMTGWFAQDALDRVRSKIGDHRPLSEAMDGIFDRFRQSVSDDLHGLYRMERTLTGGKIKPAGAYESARLSRASASIADGAVRYGYPVRKADGSFAYRGKGLYDILKPVGARLEDALLYFVGRSARELMTQGREHLFSPAEVRGMVALETPEFRKAFAEYQAWNRGILDFAEAHGVLDPATRALWKRTEYLPFHRVAQPGNLHGKPGDWTGVRALTGGTENLRDVLGNMLGNAAMLIDKAVKNEARLKIAELASRPGGGRFMTKIPPGSRPAKVSGDQVLNALLEKYGIAIKGPAPAFFEFLIHGQPPAGANVVAVLKAGKPEWYEVADPILMRALTAIDRPPMGWLNKWLGMPKRIGQAAVTMTPDFMVANIARDTIAGAIMSRSGFRPVLDSLEGMRLRVTEDPIYRDYIANGGGLSSIYLDEGKVRARLERFYSRQGIDARAVLDAPDKLLGFIETLGDAFESSTRLGEYQRAIQRGDDPRHAAYLGREVSTDFAMRGDSKALGFLYDTVMFLRPAVESFDRLYRGLAHDPNRGTIGAKAATLALMSVGLYLLNRNNPAYQDMPDWQKDSYWHFFIPGADGREQHFMYPKIWEVGALASLAERTTERLMVDDPQGLGADFARIVGTTFSLNLMPQIAAPLYEQATNRNGFSQSPIETAGMEKLQPFLRAKPGTSETMKALGMATRHLPESLQVNPVRAEALLRGYLNTWAMYGLMLSDRAFFSERLPESRADELPVVRRFYSQEPARHTRFESEFYDMLGQAARLQGTLRELDRRGQPLLADELETSRLAGENRPLSRVNENVQAINKDMQAVRRDSTLSPAEKRQRLDALSVERNQLFKAAVEAAKAAQIER